MSRGHRLTRLYDRGVGDFFERNIIEPGKLPPLLALFAFIVTFLVTRFITRSIRAGRGPFRDNVSAGGTHVHHAVPGIILLVAGAFTAISTESEPWMAIAALAVGCGTSLVLDEFALILHLKDVYWSTEGRGSVYLVGLAAACLAFVTIGFVPLGVEQVSFEEFGLRITLITNYVLNGVMVLLCVLKGKYRAALIGAFVPFAAWVSAIRLARPNSWWARRWYRERGMTKARRRDARWQQRWDPRWAGLSNLVAGRPTAPTTKHRSVLPNARPVTATPPPVTPAAAAATSHAAAALRAAERQVTDGTPAVDARPVTATRPPTTERVDQ